MLFLIVAVILCAAAGIFIQRNRELARSAPLRGEIQAQARFAATLPLGHTRVSHALAGTGAAPVPPLAGAMPRYGRTSRWLNRRPRWQFALLWWAGLMATSLVTQAAVALWHGDGVHGSWLFNAVIFSTASTAIMVWVRGGAR